MADHPTGKGPNIRSRALAVLPELERTLADRRAFLAQKPDESLKLRTQQLGHAIDLLMEVAEATYYEFGQD